MKCYAHRTTQVAAFSLPFALVFQVLGAQFTWHIRATEILGNPTSFMSVAYGEGMFVAVAYDGTIAVSIDGANWQTNMPMGAVPWLSVAHTTGKFLAVGWPTNVISSTDGTNWSVQRWPDVNAYPTGLSSTGDRFWLGASSEPDQARTLFTPTTGTNWTRSVEEFFSAPSLGEYYSAAFGARLYVGVGWDTSPFGINALLAAPTIIVSADGANWVTEWTGVDPTTPPWIRDGTSLQSVIYGDNIFIAVGSSVNTGKNIWYSVDGTNWSFETTTFPSLKSVAYGGGAYVAVGGYENSVELPGVILTSMDGKQWSVAQVVSTNSLRAVTYGQNTFVVVGDFGQIFQSDPVLTLKTTGQPGELLIRGPIGQTCSIETAEPLGEAAAWQEVGTVMITNSPTLWTDKMATNVTSRYYRAKLDL